MQLIGNENAVQIINEKIALSRCSYLQFSSIQSDTEKQSSSIQSDTEKLKLCYPRDLELDIEHHFPHNNLTSSWLLEEVFLFTSPENIAILT